MTGQDAASGVRRLFGTDGIRAPFGTFPLDRATVTGLGRHLAQSLRETTGESRPEVVLGGDTRESTPTICAWLAAGLSAGDADPRWVGVLPTAGIAYLVRGLGTAAGVAVSASHNPYPDNGIKLIDPWGFKWSEAAEAALETRLLAGRPARSEPSGTSEGGEGGALGLGSHGEALVEHYLEALASTLPGRQPLAGLRLAVDAGNGAASAFAEPLFRRLGAGIRVIHASPDGRNVNLACGSTDTRDLAREVLAGGYHLGVAFDGDADRAILVDEGGLERDGDAILYLWARELAETGSLEPARIVATSMSNLGLERALAGHGIAVERCGVGDREVVDTLRRESLLLGGEQSGHVVHLGLSTTGDGLLTALQMAFLVAREVRAGASGQAALRPARGIHPLPPGPGQRPGEREARPARAARRRGGGPRGGGAVGLRGPAGAALQRHRAARPGHDRRARAERDRGAGPQHRRRHRGGDRSGRAGRRGGSGMRLSVNVDHIATLRQARGAAYPDPVEAARIAEEAGAHGITVHLRGDRRHIQEEDVARLRASIAGKLNLEMAASDEMVAIALAHRPDHVSLVPEHPEELTTEGGLDLTRHRDRIESAARRLAGAGILVSLFLDPEARQIEAAAALPREVVGGFEINTDAYTKVARAATSEHAVEVELAKVREAARRGGEAGLHVYAGHGLTAANVGPIAGIPEIQELNIGHALISRAVLVGLAEAVREMLRAMSLRH